MKQTVISQEILLLTSAFINNHFCEKNEYADELSFSPQERLEKACWNGMLYEMLPGILNPFGKLFLWDIKREGAYLRICLGVSIPGIKNAFSLDPHYFLSYKIMN